MRLQVACVLPWSQLDCLLVEQCRSFCPSISENRRAERKRLAAPAASVTSRRLGRTSFFSEGHRVMLQHLRNAISLGSKHHWMLSREPRWSWCVRNSLYASVRRVRRWAASSDPPNPCVSMLVGIHSATCQVARARRHLPIRGEFFQA